MAIINRIFSSLKAVAIFSGILMGCAFINPALWWAGVVGLALLVYAVKRADSYKSAFWAGLFAGSIKMLFVYSWLWTVYPVDWMGDFSHPLQLGTIGWVWFVASVGTGISLGAFTFILFFKVKRVYRYLFFPLAYLGSELLGSFLFSFVELGPGSVLNADTSWGYLGYTIARHGVLGIFAKVAGVYLLSYVVALLALYFVDRVVAYEGNSIRKSRECIIAAIPLFLFIGSYFITLPVPQEHRGFSVLTINTHYVNAYQPTATEKANRVKETIAAFKTALQTGGDVIVFPETSYALSVFGTPENIFSYVDTQTDNRPLIVDSDGTVSAQNKPVIRAILYDTRTRSTHSFFKEFLVPTGEYVPYHLSFLMKLTGFTEINEYLSKAMAFKNNESTEKRVITSMPGILFCSEVLSSKLVYKASKRATLPLLVHPVSHGWFHTPHAFWYQLDLILRTQARFADLPIVQAANMWESRAYNENGLPIQGTIVWEGDHTNVVKYDL